MPATNTVALTATGEAMLSKTGAATNDNTTTVMFYGTYAGIQGVFQGTTDATPADGGNWFPLAAIALSTREVIAGSSTITVSTDAEVGYQLSTAGLTGVRFHVTAYGSGTFNVKLSSASYSSIPVVSQTSTGQTLSGAFVLSGGLDLPDSALARFGDADDITMAWDGTDFDVLQATANSSIKWGIDGAGIDQVWYGDTASTNMTWDQSADSLIFNGAARIVWTGTTGQPEMHLTDNLADALSIEISGAADLAVFTTTDNAESVALLGTRHMQSTAVAITGATTLKLSDSGGIWTVGQGSAYDIDLPSPTSGAGCRYFFSLTAPGANNVTITVAGGAATFVGQLITEGQIIVATGSTLTFASGVSVLGDSIEIQSIATNLYHVRAVSSILNGITVS